MTILTSGIEDHTAPMVADLFPSDYTGVYVDVGAGFPVFYSQSYHFRKLGWQVIAIEPQKNMCDEFRALGYPVLEYACFSSDIGETDFYVVDCVCGLGGSALKVVDPQPPGREVRKIRVEAYTLDTILTLYHPELESIDVLGIDVECHELSVLQGFSIERYKPTVLVIENLPTDNADDPNRYRWLNLQRQQLYEYYEAKGYEIVAQAAWNEILMRK